MTLETLIQQLSPRFKTADIEKAYNEAVKETGSEGPAAERIAALKLRQLGTASKFNATFLYVSPLQHVRRSAIMNVDKVVREKGPVAAEENQAIVYVKQADGSFQEYRPTPNGVSMRLVAAVPNELTGFDGKDYRVVPIAINENLWFIPVDSREKYGSNPNDNWLYPVKSNTVRFALGVVQYNSVAKPAYLRINDHLSGPVEEFDIPLNQPIAIANAVAELKGNVVRLNSTPSLAIVAGEEFVDPMMINDLLTPTQISQLLVGDHSIIQGDVFSVLARAPDAEKNHVINVAGEGSFDPADEIACFIPVDFEMPLQQGSRVIVVGNKIELKQGTAFGADFFVELPL